MLRFIQLICLMIFLPLFLFAQPPSDTPVAEKKKMRETNTVLKSYFANYQNTKPDSAAAAAPPPSITSDMVDGWIKEVELDSSSQKMTVEEYEKRMARFTELYHHTHMLAKYATAYSASEDKMKKLQTMSVRIVRSMAIARNNIDEAKKAAGAIVRKKMRNLYIHDVYDVEKKIFVNHDFITEIKNNIFYLGYPINFRCPTIGTFLPDCKKYGLNPKHSADGIRMSLDDTYNLIVLKIKNTQDVKLVLWNKGFVKIGQSRVVDVY